jgi:hypothetical protein
MIPCRVLADPKYSLSEQNPADKAAEKETHLFKMLQKP